MQPTWREKDPSSQGPHNDSACGKQHVGVVCLVPACSGARVYQRTKVEKTPLVPQDRSINQTVRNWSRSARRPRGTRSSECSDDFRSRVRSCRRATNNSRQEVGLISHAASTADQGQNVYKLNDLEALGNKASSCERCPRGQRRRCLAQAVQAWTDSNEKTARGGTPEPKKVKEHSQLQAIRAYPTAGKELELLVIKHSAIEKIVEIPSEVECKSSHSTKQCRDSDSST